MMNGVFLPLPADACDRGGPLVGQIGAWMLQNAPCRNSGVEWLLSFLSSLLQVETDGRSTALGNSTEMIIEVPIRTAMIASDHSIGNFPPN